MTDDEAMTLGALLLAAGNALVDGIHAGVVARGFADLRPAHGFAFALLAPSGATVSELAVHLGVTRQAAAQMVDELVAKGYVVRRPHPDDRRAQLVVLTERGWACTRAATQAAGDTVRNWGMVLGSTVLGGTVPGGTVVDDAGPGSAGPGSAGPGAERLRALRDDLAAIAPAGRLRPTW